MARRNTDCSVYQLVAKDFGDLHRHQVFRVTQVGPDKNLKMSILAALIIPTLAYDPAALPLDVNPIAIRNCAGSGAPSFSIMGAMHWAT